MKNIFIIILLIITSSCTKDEDSYDYRNEIVGSYYCYYKYTIWSIDTSYISFHHDTVYVGKFGDQKIQIWNEVFVLDSEWKFSEYRGGNSYIKIQFLPDKDSIYYFISSGGLGGGTVFDYKGIKVKNAW